jgi:hypothetical protein
MLAAQRRPSRIGKEKPVPRNITVTFNDGSSHVYQNAPDGITPGQVAARAAAEFKKPIQNIDGGNQAAPAPAPRMTAPTRNAPAVPVTTHAQEIQNLAKKYVDQHSQASAAPGFTNFLQSAAAASGRLMLGVPERIQAAADYYAPKVSHSDAPPSKSYADALALRRAITDQQRSRSTAGNVVGTVGGAVASGASEAKAAGFVGSKLAATGAPIIARAGNILEGLTTLKKGQTAKNALKLATAGAVGGAAQAGGEGSDVKQGAEYGAAGALALGAGGKLVSSVVPKIVRTVARPFSKDVGKALRETVTEAPEAIASRQADLSAKTGAPVPTVAALNDQDFSNVSKKVLAKSPEANEIAKGKTGQYIRGFMDRMLAHVNAAGKAGDAQQVAGAGDLAEIRQNTADGLMAPIRDKTVDMSTIPLGDVERSVTKQAGGRIVGLGPRIKQAFADIPPDDLMSGDVSGEDIAAAKKLMQNFGLGKPVNATVGELDSLRRTLSSASNKLSGSNPVEAMAYKNAAKTIADHVGNAFPEYKTMVDTYAAHSRMLEGFDAAAAGKRPADIVDDQARANLQSPEGRVGMKAGELYRLRQQASGKPTGAINLARDLASEGALTRPASLDPQAANPGSVTENLGDAPAANLATAAQGETQVLGRMVDAGKVNAMAANEEGALSPEEIAFGAMLHGAHPMTQARFMARLVSKLPSGFNPEVAKNMTDMLFSGDPVKAQTVMNALQKTGVTKQILGGILQDAGAAGAAPGAINADAQQPGPAPAPAPNMQTDIPELAEPLPDADAAPEPAQSEPAAPAGQPADQGGYTPEAAPEQPQIDPTKPYGHQVISSLFPEAEITEDVRDPNSKLGRENPNSDHIKTQNAVDVKPIPGMTFNDFIAKIHNNGHQIIEAIDEVNHPSKYATGPHWHVVVG